MFEIEKEDNRQFILEKRCVRALELKGVIDGLAREKKEIEDLIRESLGHECGDDGAKTYKKGDCKVQITTGYNYRVDVGAYKICKKKISGNIIPFSEKITYSVDKKRMRLMEELATPDELSLIHDAIITTMKSPTVKIEINRDYIT